MTLGIIQYGGKELGFGTYLSTPRPAGKIIDEVILLHKASELDIKQDQGFPAAP